MVFTHLFMAHLCCLIEIYSTNHHITQSLLLSRKALNSLSKGFFIMQPLIGIMPMKALILPPKSKQITSHGLTQPQINTPTLFIILAPRKVQPSTHTRTPRNGSIYFPLGQETQNYLTTRPLSHKPADLDASV